MKKIFGISLFFLLFYFIIGSKSQTYPGNFLISELFTQPVLVSPNQEFFLSFRIGVNTTNELDEEQNIETNQENDIQIIPVGYVFFDFAFQQDFFVKKETK